MSFQQYEQDFINHLENQMNEFINTNREEIISLYKGNIAVFQCFYDGNGVLQRHIPELQICLSEKGEMFINHTVEKFNEMYNKPESSPGNPGNEDSPVFTGCTIAYFKDKEFVKCYDRQDEKSFNLSMVEYKKVNNYYVMVQQEQNKLMDSKPMLEDEDINYNCDAPNCGKRVTLNGMMCESCNYDLCHNCKQLSESHPHKMFEYKGYIGWNTYDSNDILTHTTIPL